MATSVPITTSNAAIAAIPTGSANQPFGSPVTVTGEGRLDDISSLTLANGMTAGYGDTQQHTQNPPAYPGTYGSHPNYMGRTWEPNRVGLIRTVPGALNKQYSLYFIFNPNLIMASFQTNMSSTPPMYLYGITAQDSDVSPASVPNLASSQTVGWSLYFDRTYDMLYDANPDNNLGVLADVAALYNLMGTFDSQGAVPVSVPVQVVFAQNGEGKLWGLTGFINSVNITYGEFRHNMIPSRCEVDLQMTCSYVSSQTPAASGGGTVVGSSTASTSSVTGPSFAGVSGSGNANLLSVAAVPVAK